MATAKKGPHRSQCSFCEKDQPQSNLVITGQGQAAVCYDCGKTLLVETLVRTLEAPFTVSHATSLTESGYVGEDVEIILLRVIQGAEWDVSWAEQGIIYIDELDKIAPNWSKSPPRY